MKILRICGLALTLITFLGVSNLFAAPSGDVVVDAIMGYYDVKVGNDTAPSSLNPSLYTGGVHLCNPHPAVAWEGNCPSDLAYTPSAHTGGYQAYAAGLTRIDELDIFYVVCYYGYAYDIDGNITGIFPYCDAYFVGTMPEQTWGATTARIVFGDTTTSTPWGPQPMSTMAFKGNNIYNNPMVPAAACDPEIDALLADAPCHPDQTNVYTVPDSGYEDKVLVQDHGCDPIGPKRTGYSYEMNLDCFVHDMDWYADLPAAYLDTQLLDGPEYYLGSVGTAQPWNITEGWSYFWYTTFAQLGVESTAPHIVRHNSAVTTFYNLMIGCPANCMFSVDQTTIAPVITNLP